MAYGSWREADTGYIIYSPTNAAAMVAYSPDGVGCYYYDSKADMLADVTPEKIVRVGMDTWDKNYY